MMGGRGAIVHLLGFLVFEIWSSVVTRGDGTFKRWNLL